MEKLLKKFDLNFQNIFTNKYPNPNVNYVKKIKEIWKKSKENDYLIKVNLENNYLKSNYFPNYKPGQLQVWYGIWKALFFFGLIQKRKYDEKQLENGIKIKEFMNYDTLEKYLKSKEGKDNIMSNFNKDKKYFQKTLIGGILNYLCENENSYSKIIEKNKEEIDKYKKKQYKSKYKNLIEYINKIFSNCDFLNLTKEIKNKAKKEIIKIIKKYPEIQNYRHKFREKIDEQFKKRNVLKEINKYAKTFDINIKMEKPDRAHIIPVWLLVKEERWEEIKNPNNGLILDPNTHRLFDNDKNIEITKDLTTIKNEYHKFKIHNDFLTPERKIFLKEWMRRKKDIFE